MMLLGHNGANSSGVLISDGSKLNEEEFSAIPAIPNNRGIPSTCVNIDDYVLCCGSDTVCNHVLRTLLMD